MIVMIACSINERMQKALDYKSEEVLILKEVLREVTQNKRIDFTEVQRARLALLGKQLTTKERREYCEIVRPKTKTFVSEIESAPTVKRADKMVDNKDPKTPRTPTVLIVKYVHRITAKKRRRRSTRARITDR